MKQNNRIEERTSFQQDCILSNGFGKIKCKTVDVSRVGVGVLINGPIPFQNADILSVYIKSLSHRSLANIQWIKQDDNIKETRVGLKVSSSLYAIKSSP